MKVLLSWLREFVPVELSPAELASRLSLAGLAVERVDGDVLDLDLTSNRPDWLSHYGVAREISAVTAQPLAGLAAAPVPDVSAGVPVQISAPEGCGRYLALLLDNVQVGASPRAVADRLEALGHRAINNYADLTNYTLWEMGHPTHAFDADKLRGGRIEVRFARRGEKLVTLDEVERELEPQDLVIADAERPVALAGVMGGLETAVTSATRRVLIESAWFDPLTVRRTARRHGLHTDASHRFERGADPEAPRLAAGLILQRARAYGARLAGQGEASGHLPRAQAIELRASAVERILGKTIALAECEALLSRLGCVALGTGKWQPATFRPDLVREIDLIEEVARLHGYEHFPARLPAFQGVAAGLPEAAMRDRVRGQLRGRGFAEAVTLSFASEAECQRFAPDARAVRVLNPLSEEAAILRTSSLPAMLHLLRNNLNHGVGTPRLYEIGKLYDLPESKPRERAVLTLGACDAGLDFGGFKGEIAAVLGSFAVGEPACTADAPEYLHPGRSAREGDLALFGQIHPGLAGEWKLPAHTWLAEVALDALYAAGPRRLEYHPPSRFPGSERDFSFLFADTVLWAQIEAGLAQPPITLLRSVQPAEPPFRGPALPTGHYSLLIRARFQSDERTLRDEEVQAGADELASRLRRLGGQQR